MKREHSGLEDGISYSDRRRHVLLPPETKLRAIVDVKEEEDFLENVNQGGVDWTSSVPGVQGFLNQAMSSVCVVYDVAFQSL